MKKMIPLVMIGLAACDQSVPTDSVDSLVSNPKRLNELREQCKTIRDEMGDELCRVVAEAARKRFMGDEAVPYTPPNEQPRF